MSDKIKMNASTSEDKDEINLSRIIGALLLDRWLIISVTSLFAIIGISIILFSTPIYLSDALVQVEQDTGNSLLNDLSQILPNSTQPQSEAEIELIKSRLVIGKTIDELHLDIKVKQKYFPLFGGGISRLLGDIPAELHISKFDIPQELYEQGFILKVVDGQNYILKSGSNTVVKGKVGKISNNNGISILVDSFTAAPNTEFTIAKYAKLRAISDLLNDLTITDAGKDTGVLILTLTGDNPNLIKSTLNLITRNYQEQNIERKSEEDGKSLAFLKEQIPDVRKKLDEAEDKLNLYRENNDSVDLSLEAKSLLDTMVATQTELNQLTFAETEISKLYTKEHPSYIALLQKRKTLEDQRDSLNRRIADMPKTQQGIIMLSRDVRADQEIYMQLLNKQQELTISKASTIGNVRIVDPAETKIKPVKPNKLLIIIFSITLGLVFSIIFVLIKTALHQGIESPEELEAVGINVYASVPMSEWQVKKDREVKARNKRSKTNKVYITARDNPTDLAVEAMRSLRTSLYFAMLGAANKILMIAGASPGIGKTFVSVNLATIIAQTGLKVLLIDCDMRRGYSHELMGCKATPGLSDLISEQVNLSSAINKTDIENLDFLPRGQIPPNPSELLLRPKFKEIISELNSLYDMILVDTPPILAVTDAAIIGRLAGTSLMVARFEQNSVKEIEMAVKRFAQNDIDIKGVILNAVVKRSSGYYGYGENYYNYEYKSHSNE